MIKHYGNLRGKTYNHLLIKEEVGKDPLGRTLGLCKCSCGKLRILPISRVVAGHYKSCGCLRKRSREQSPTFKGCGQITGTLWNQIRVGASRRHHSFNITLEQMWKLFLKQKRKCALSGLELKFGTRFYGEETTASLDRIDSTKGYDMDNVQWVHKDINWMKQDFSQSEFIDYCKRVVKKWSRSISSDAGAS
jgi:hypothetical protein